MERYLLFDSACSSCSKIAEEIAEQVGQRLIVRSLHDPEIQELLHRANPSWRWAPTLLEVSDEKVLAYTGLMMRGRLVLWLGLRRARQLTGLIYRHAVAAHATTPVDVGRRQFLWQSGKSLAALVLLTGVPKLHDKSSNFSWQNEGQFSASYSATQDAPMEIYESFVLLPEETLSPSFVRKARHIELHGGITAYAGTSIQIDSIDELKKRVSFPIYTPTVLPPDMQFAEASITQFAQSGDIWSVYANFTTVESVYGQITVWARPEYPRPFPVWPVRFPFAHDEGPVAPEKIDFTPSPGVMLPNMLGYSFLWIKHDVLYSLFVENYASRDQAAAIAASLKQA